MFFTSETLAKESKNKKSEKCLKNTAKSPPSMSSRIPSQGYSNFFRSNPSECRGFAFINYAAGDQAAAAKAALDGQKVHGRDLKIEVAKRGQGHEKTPGEYKGHYRSKHNKGRRSPSPYGR